MVNSPRYITRCPEYYHEINQNKTVVQRTLICLCSCSEKNCKLFSISITLLFEKCSKKISFSTAVLLCGLTKFKNL